MYTHREEITWQNDHITYLTSNNVEILFGIYTIDICITLSNIMASWKRCSAETGRGIVFKLAYFLSYPFKYIYIGLQNLLYRIFNIYEKL